MRVEVLVNGIHGGRFLKEQLAKEQLALDLPAGATLGGLLREARRRAALDLLALDGPGTVSMLAGRRIDLRADGAVALHDGDLLALLSPLAGG